MPPFRVKTLYMLSLIVRMIIVPLIIVNLVRLVRQHCATVMCTKQLAQYLAAE